MRTVAVLHWLICLSLVSEGTCGGYINGGYSDPCSSYRELKAGDRAADFQTLTKRSDSKKSFKVGWYRVLGKAGDKIASMDEEGCLKSPSCGAKYPGFLMKKHPDDSLQTGTSVHATVCFSKGTTCCGYTRQIEIMKCTDFFIYNLPRAPVGRGRYCGNGVETEKPDCDEEEILLGLTEKYAAKSCKELKEKRKDAVTGVYWVKPDGANSTQVYCDQETDGGGWTLVFSYTFTNFRNFRSGSNAITPRPDWPIDASYYGNIPISTEAPKSETDYNALDFNLWKALGHEFMVKSNINHIIACREGTGSLVDFRGGSVDCRIIKNVAYKCLNYVPDELDILRLNGRVLGPDLRRSQSATYLKEYYFFEAGTRSANWPTHDPCGTNSLNHRTDVTNPRGNIYIR